MRLCAGGRKRRVAALPAGTRMGSGGQGASLGAVDNGDGWRPDYCSVDATLLRFGGGRGSLLPPPVNCCGPLDDNGSDHGD